MRNIMECDGCGRQAKKFEDANGWLHLETLIAPTDELEAIFKRRGGMLEKDDPEVRKHIPATIGGDFCRADCLQIYLSERKAAIVKENEEFEANLKALDKVASGVYV